MKTMLLLCTCMLLSLTVGFGFPITSEPLKNNPDSWGTLDDTLVVINPLVDVRDPLQQALIAVPNLKAKKITAKSIFIAPNSLNSGNSLHYQCAPGYRIDDNGKCIKTVTINQDDILAARINALFGIDANNKINIDNDDYYDTDDDNQESTDVFGPLQINLPLSIDGEDTMRHAMHNIDNFNQRITTTEKLDDDLTTTTDAPTAPTESTIQEDFIVSTMPTEVTEETTMENIFTEETTIATTMIPETTTDYIISVDFVPKGMRTVTGTEIGEKMRIPSPKENHDHRTRKQKTSHHRTTHRQKPITKLYKLNRLQLPKQHLNLPTTKSPVPNRRTTTTPSPVINTTKDSFWWLPKGWKVDQTKENPTLVRFWFNEMPLVEEKMKPRHNSHPSTHRINSRKPTESLFKEMKGLELQKVWKK
ncbi:unnamed protein product [Diamesa hyperborea]